MKNIIKILLRLIVLPFFLGFVFIAFNWQVLSRCYYFILYGGEMIFMGKDDNKTVQELYWELKKNRKC